MFSPPLPHPHPPVTTTTCPHPQILSVSRKNAPKMSVTRRYSTRNSLPGLSCGSWMAIPSAGTFPHGGTGPSSDQTARPPPCPGPRLGGTRRRGRLGGCLARLGGAAAGGGSTGMSRAPLLVLSPAPDRAGALAFGTRLRTLPPAEISGPGEPGPSLRPEPHHRPPPRGRSGATAGAHGHALATGLDVGAADGGPRSLPVLGGGVDAMTDFVRFRLPRYWEAWMRRNWRSAGATSGSGEPSIPRSMPR